MLRLLETGQALYVLAGICLLGILTRLINGNLYKRLIRESANMAAAKNKGLKELKSRAENTYRVNQGIRDCGSWLEHQLCELRFRGLTLAGWSNLSLQLTWLCLLVGGAAAFFSYWYQLDTYYIVLYGGGAVLLSMLTMLFDGGAAAGRRERLAAALLDYLENVLCPRLARNLTEDGARGEGVESGRGKVRTLSRVDRNVHSERTRVSEQGDGTERNGNRGGAAGREEAPDRGERAGLRASADSPGKRTVRGGRRETAATADAAEGQEPEAGAPRDMDYLKRSLEQIAASREKDRKGEENWLKELRPEDVQLIGDILKEYLA